MVTAESKVDLPPKNSAKYIFRDGLDLAIEYNKRGVPQAEYDKLFGGNER